MSDCVYIAIGIMDGDTAVTLGVHTQISKARETVRADERKLRGPYDAYWIEKWEVDKGRIYDLRP